MTENKHLLVVEDEGIIAMHIENTLTNAGYTVTLAGSAEEALQKASERLPVLALLDIMLAGDKDGVWTAAALTERFDIPIVFLTGHADEKTVERAKATRPYGYVLKPFHERQLVTTVELAIQRHAREAMMQARGLSFSSILETLSEAVVLVDGQGMVQSVNAAAVRLAGCAPQAAVGLGIADLPCWGGSAQQEKVRLATAAALRDNQLVVLSELVVEAPNGDGGGYRGDRIVPLHDEQHQVVGAALIFQSAHPGASSSSNGGLPPGMSPATPQGAGHLPDPLTGLPTRAEAEIFLAGVQGDRCVFAAPLRIERFSFLNQRFSKSLADAVLQYYAVFLAQEISPDDRLYRWSGPCFVVMVEEHTSLPSARRYVSGFASTRLEQAFHHQGRSSVLFVTANWTVIPVCPQDSPKGVVAKIDDFLSSCPE